MKVKSYPRSKTYNRLDKEGNTGYSSCMTRENSGRRKKAKWLARPFSTKMIPFHQRKFGKESWVWGQKSVWKDMLAYIQNSGWSLTTKRIFSSGQTLARDRRQSSQALGRISCKKIRTESLDRSQQKGLTFSQILEMPLACKRKEPEN